MKIAPTLARNKLNAAIAAVAKVNWLFANDPTTDFTRERKLPMDSLLRQMLKFSGKSLQSELSAYYSPPGRSPQTIPTKSAFLGGLLYVASNIHGFSALFEDF